MKKNVSPVTALIAILITVSCVGYALWYFGLRERPRPEHIGLPPFLQKMEDARSADFKKKLAEQEAKKAVKASGSSTSKGGAPAGQGASDAKSPASKDASAGTTEGR